MPISTALSTEVPHIQTRLLLVSGLLKTQRNAPGPSLPSCRSQVLEASFSNDKSLSAQDVVVEIQRGGTFTIGLAGRSVRRTTALEMLIILQRATSKTSERDKGCTMPCKTCNGPV